MFKDFLKKDIDLNNVDINEIFNNPMFKDFKNMEKSDRNFTWTEKNINKLNKVKDILTELEKYKPLTLRQVYYQLVGKGFIENNKSQYIMLSNLLKYARIDGEIAWTDIEDRVRVYNDLTGFTDQEQFINYEIKNFLNGYSRNLLQNQEVYIEIWIEKDALSSIFKKVAINYSVPVVVSRGFTSISFLNQFRDRVEYYQGIGKKIIMLYFGDFDPSGLEMLEANQRTIENELNIYDIEYKRIALLKPDIDKYKLPHDPDALKKTDTRYKKFIKKYGSYAVELDALRPDVLEQKIHTAIKSIIDINLLNEQIEKHNNDINELKIIKNKVKDYIKCIA